MGGSHWWLTLHRAHETCSDTSLSVSTETHVLGARWCAWRQGVSEYSSAGDSIVRSGRMWHQHSLRYGSAAWCASTPVTSRAQHVGGAIDTACSEVPAQQVCSCEYPSVIHERHQAGLVSWPHCKHHSSVFHSYMLYSRWGGCQCQREWLAGV
jgi:hypothetical protein